MKKIIILFAIFVLTIQVIQAQNKVYDTWDDTPSLQEGDYVKDNRIDKYVGTWEWKSGNETFTIVIKKKAKVLRETPSGNYYSDFAIGWHKYIKNGKIIENTMDKINVNITSVRNMTGNCSLNGSTTSNHLSMFIENSMKKYIAHVTLTLVPGKTDELQWQIYNKNTTIPGKQENYTIPVNMVLKKVNPVSGGIVGGGFGTVVVQ